jgi:uncharacterized protein YkwD
MLGACSANHEFWDRSPCVAGARQVAPDCPPIQLRPTPQVQPPAYAPPPAATPPTGAQPGTAEEMEVLSLVNRIRAQHALRPLRFHPTLWTAARDHSLEQQRHGYMGHGSPDPRRARLSQRIAIAGYQGRVFAEVVAWGYTSTQAVVEGWMNSDDHRRILLDPEMMEAGFSRAGQYWTGNLGAPLRIGTRAAPARPGYERTPAARPPAAPRRAAPRSAPKPAPQFTLPRQPSGFG